MLQPVILIVDDEKNTREGLRQILEEDFDVYTAPDIAGATAVLQAEVVELVITDLKLAGEDGMTLLDRVLALPNPPACIVMTAYGSVDTAVEAMKRGAYDFLTKPLDLDQLELRVRRALKSRRLEKENIDLKQQIDRKFGLENLIGESPEMVEVFDTIRQVAPSRATVLVDGESGTGKELVARAIHTLSRRSQSKFVAVHCAALTPSLLESELFGHEKGAFTGATERRIGRFEQADGGTIFLDEIGEIDSTIQVKLLRVLGERSFERVGGNKQISVDVRLVAATNKDLAQMVSKGTFRDDLYHRINVVRIWLPPLRSRRSDIPLLAAAFLRQFSEENEREKMEFSGEAMRALLEYDWPGNVRELRAAVEHGVVMARTEVISPRELPATVREGPGATDSLAPASSSAPTNPFNIGQTEERLILRVLDQTGGNVTAAAKRLGISRRTMHRRLEKLRADGRI